MGKMQSKAVGVAMSQKRSGSFDSINTVTSIGTEHPFICRSNSMDSLIRKKTQPSHICSKSSPPKRKEDGKTYTALVDSASVQTSFSACDRNSELVLNTHPEAAPTASSHKDGKLRLKCGDDVTGLDDTLLDQDLVANRLTEELDDRLQARLGDNGSGDLITRELHPDIIQKLSKEEWKQLISYTCSTLGRSLLASILKQPSLLEDLIQAGQQENSPPPESPSPESPKYIRRLNEKPVHGYKLDIESVLRKLQETDLASRREKPKKKLERTCSLPPLHDSKVKRDSEGELGAAPGMMDLFVLSDGNEVGSSSVGNVQMASYGADRSEASVNTPEHSRSPGEATGQKSRHEKEHTSGRHKCSHSKCHSGSGKKMRGRSRSDSVRDPNSLVDTSLDDDCPGLPENRVRRPRHHHHQHYVCKQCLEECGGKGWNRGKVTKKGWCRKHSPDHENLNSSGSGGEHAPVGPELSVSLNHIQALERATELVDDEISVDDEIGQVLTSRLDLEGIRHGVGHVYLNEGGAHHEGRHHSRKKNGTWAHSGMDSHPKNSSNPSGSTEGQPQAAEDSQDFVELSTVPSRSGRDSPATDMAVCCLDLNHPRMIQPAGNQRHRYLGQNGLQMSDLGDVRHIYLHNHQHYHHIIHHSQP